MYIRVLEYNSLSAATWLQLLLICRPVKLIEPVICLPHPDKERWDRHKTIAIDVAIRKEGNGRHKGITGS